MNRPTEREIRALVVEHTERLFCDAVTHLGSHRFNDPPNELDERMLHAVHELLVAMLVRSYRP